MNKLLRRALILTAALFASACVLVPVEPKPGPPSCPPGQAKKGNCMPEGGFCPPGHAKKGQC